jgi:CheY-like chemotaxis protein
MQFDVPVLDLNMPGMGGIEVRGKFYRSLLLDFSRNF